MFNQTKLFYFKLFIVTLSKNIAYHNRFVFDENTNDLVDLHGLRYERNDLEDANNCTIKIVGSHGVGFPQLFIILILQQIMRFRIEQYYSKYNWEKLVLIGEMDMNLMIYGSNLPYQSIHPLISATDQLFVVNMEMIGTPTYFIELFDVYLWIAFLVSFTLIGVFSTLGLYLLQRFTSSQLDYLEWFSILTNQGGNENFSQLIFPKILLVSISIIAIIFHGLFGAFLSSYLAIRNPDLPFTTLYGVLHIPEYTICTPYRTSSYRYIVNYLRETTSGVSINHRLNNENCPKEFNQERVATQIGKKIDFCPKGSSVFFVTTLVEFGNDNCSDFNIIALKEKYRKRYDSILVSPGFKYREQFNRNVVRLRTAGILNRFEVKLHRIRSKFEDRFMHLKHDSGINIHQVKIILLIPIVGIVLGIIVFMFERMVNKYFCRGS